MVAFTAAKGLYQVANSSFVGTWDVPENSNWGVVDAALGQITTIQLNNTPVTLTAGQVQSCQLVFSSSAAPGGNLAGNVAVTFPLVSPSSTTLTGPYIIQNLCGNSSLFVITLQTTIAGGQVIACKPGEPFDVINDGTNFKYKNLGHIGSYWDYIGSSVPNWVTACTVPPYLNCDGTTFSSAVYPVLASIHGTTLPDSKGRTRFALDQSAGRLTSSGGIDGTTIGAGGGNQLTLLSTSNIPFIDHNHGVKANTSILYATGGNSQIGIFGALSSAGSFDFGAVSLSTVGTAINSTGISAAQTLNPGYVGGITMVRAG